MLSDPISDAQSDAFVPDNVSPPAAVAAPVEAAGATHSSASPMPAERAAAPATVQNRLPANYPLLSDAQQTAMIAIIEGKSVDEAAVAANVCRMTLWRWRAEDPLFMMAMNVWRRQMREDLNDSLAHLRKAATDAVAALVGKNNLQAAKVVLRHAEAERIGASSPEGVKRRSARRRRKVEESTISALANLPRKVSGKVRDRLIDNVLKQDAEMKKDA